MSRIKGEKALKQVEIIRQGVVHSQPGDRFGYFAWPSVARLADGTLVAGASGMRIAHICPWGRTTLFFSHDDGETWSCPVVVNDTPLDDRDVGLLHMGGNKLLVSWFNLESRYFSRETGFFRTSCGMNEDDFNLSLAVTERYPADVDEKYAGSFVRVSEDGGTTWGQAHKVPVTTPHGPNLLSDGSLLFIGKGFKRKEADDIIGVYRSVDDGANWQKLSEIPFPADTNLSNFFEPHVIELPSGRLLAQIRYQDYKRLNPHPYTFSIYQTFSDDHGATWETAKPLMTSGSPPHIIRHSSGALVSVYARREEPFGELAMISRDDGATWNFDYLLRPAVEGDIGYPCSTELADGSILTVYYQHLTHGDKASILYTRWKLPE